MKYGVCALAAFAASVACGVSAARGAVFFNTTGATVGAVNDFILIGAVPASTPITVYANTGTSVTGSISVLNASRFSMSGGFVAGAIVSEDTSTVNFSGGTCGASLQSGYSSTFNISGGSVSSLVSSFHNSVMNVSGGSFSGLQAQDSSVLNLRGGVFPATQAGAATGFGSAVINIYGTNLQAVPVGLIGGRRYYALSGVLEDGTSLAGRMLAIQNGSNATFNLIPSPCTAALLAIGGFAAARRARPQRVR